jgi:hypothetical protein
MHYQSYGSTQKTNQKSWAIHPVWRGIGCILMVIIPFMSYAAAVILLDENRKRGWFDIPAEIRAIPVPDFISRTLPAWVASDFYAKILMAVFLALVIFGLLTVFYSFAYRLGGGYRLSPMDAPPIRRKTKRSR